MAGIEELMAKTQAVMTQIRESEEMVEHITAEIKAFDRAKRNLNTAITTLNRLNMLSGGLNQLKLLAGQNQYLEITKVMSGVQNVLEPFECYKDVPQVRH
jgi:prefoldin subunit 5